MSNSNAPLELAEASVDFRHVNTWIFDLDNTLYPAECHLFAQIDVKMTQFIEQRLNLPYDEARYLQKHFYALHGTTLSGLMQEYDIPPHDFMDFVHDIDLSDISPDHDLHAALCALPGQKLIFTNGSVKHAENVAGKIGILDLFDGVFDIEQAGWVPKPHMGPYETFLKQFDVDPTKAAMFEDMPVNLKVPHDMGIATVLVHSTAEWFEDEPEEKRPARPGDTFDHVHHSTADLTAFLERLITSA